MRIAIDMQGALTDGSRPRGIGRYTSQLVEAMTRQRGEHDLRLLLNARFRDACRSTTRQFSSLLSQEALSSYLVPKSGGFHTPPHSPERQAADAIMQRHVAGLQPDVLLFSSIFEVAPEDFSPINLRRYPARLTSSIVYDFIPAIFDDLYLADPLVRRNYFTTLDILKQADLLLAISESARQDAISWMDVAPERVVNISAAADGRFRPLALSEQDKEDVMQSQGLSRPFVMYVSGSDPRKNLRGAVAAFAALRPEIRRQHQLLLVSRLGEEEAAAFHRYAAKLGIEHDGLVLASGISDEELVHLFNSCRAFLFPSFYEGFGLPVLEAMQCGAPVLAAGNSSLPEIVDRDDLLFDAAKPASAARMLERILTEEDLRKELSEWGKRRAGHFTWDRSASLALEALESAASDGHARPHVMPCELLDLDSARSEIVDILAERPECDEHIGGLVDSLFQATPLFRDETARRLLIDVTDTSESEHWTGIQRVVRRLTTAFYEQGVLGSVVPVAVRLEASGAISVPGFVARTFGHSQEIAPYPIEIRSRDDLFMLDSNWIRYPDYAPLFEEVTRLGGRIVTCIYDLIPELHPEVCLTGVPAVHERWLRKAIATSHALLCISRAVADELIAYIRENMLPHRPGLKIGWFHCGSDILRASQSQPPQPATRRSFTRDRPTFLSVGTLEPRKNHALALKAFERLWAGKGDASLCIIGRRGWNIAEFEEQLLSHPEYGCRLHWLSNASDVDLLYAYQHAEAVLCPSIAEGFGLPVVEAARMDKPVICSDIPVFREIGGRGAVYFPCNDAAALEAVLSDWLANGHGADPSLVSRISWADAAARIHQILQKEDWYAVLE
ncbi:glycosyltransferase family 1 protein [Roseomonas gilardii]|uniref:glycosyltransferase family 4 protein n=1 Tax=Roseomonas gilardii TaxID=257708 RepID=UPI0011A2B560|nr:glycosyltransferase family 1 protein [Roseomonas gilardii]